jgi:hypothetical protein
VVAWAWQPQLEVKLKKGLSIPSQIPAINVAVDAFVGLSMHDYSAAYVDVDE